MTLTLCQSGNTNHQDLLESAVIQSVMSHFKQNLMHCSVIKSLEREQNGSDDDSIAIWKHTCENTADTVTKPTVAAVLYVAKHLLVGKAVLLPWVCTIFLESYGWTDSGNVNSLELSLELGETSVQFSSRWLLHQLIVYLESYLLYKCVHKQIGTILYRSGVDPIISLSWALSTLQASNSCYNEPAKYDKSLLSKEQVLTYAGCIVNDMVHEENKKQSSASSIIDPSQFSISECLQNVDPLLVKFLLTATSTARERQHCHINEQTKLAHTFFIICLLQFSTNRKQPTFFHHLLSDVVEVCSGSHQLMRILGCVSLPDTHDRFVTEHAQLKCQTSI